MPTGLARNAFHAVQGVTEGWRARADWVNDDGALSLQRLAAAYGDESVCVSAVTMCASPICSSHELKASCIVNARCAKHALTQDMR